MTNAERYAILAQAKTILSDLAAEHVAKGCGIADKAVRYCEEWDGPGAGRAVWFGRSAEACERASVGIETALVAMHAYLDDAEAEAALRDPLIGVVS